MKTSRSERDYIFGSAMMTLRTAIGLKQAEVVGAGQVITDLLLQTLQF